MKAIFLISDTLLNGMSGSVEVRANLAVEQKKTIKY